MYKLTTLLLLALLCSCGNVSNSFTQQVEHAHNADEYKNHQAVKFNLKLTMGGKTRLDGTVYTLTNMGKTRIEKADGTLVVYDGQNAYYSPSTLDYPKARFDALTWPYFFNAPYKLNDPGSNIEELGSQDLNGITYDVAKMTFKGGTGDSPDDWYIIYKDTATHLVYAMAYIVTTQTKSKEKAEENPHAIVYKNYKEVKGIPIATVWEYWEWREGKGLTKQIGEGTISDIEFLNSEEIDFTQPKDSKIAPVV